MYGNGGNDTITGGTGNDVIYGGKGNDLLTGGGANDLFVFHPDDGHDTITDYHRGDHMQFDGIAAGGAAIIQEHGPPLPGQSGELCRNLGDAVIRRRSALACC